MSCPECQKIINGMNAFIQKSIQNNDFSIPDFFETLCREIADETDCNVAIISRNMKIMARKGFAASPYKLSADYKPLKPEFCLTSVIELLMRQFRQKEPISAVKKVQSVFHYSFALSCGGQPPAYIMVIKCRNNSNHSEEGLLLFRELAEFISVQLYFFQLKVKEDTFYLKFINSMQKVLQNVSPQIYSHCLRTAEHVGVMGKLLNLNEKDMVHLIDVSLIHDIGYVSVPRQILHKPANLTNSEYDVIKKSVEVGYKILSSPIFFELETMGKIILSHYERMDGTGYPRSLKGNQIPRTCRILSIANAFDAMTSVRPYQKPLSVREALEELKRCSGMKFDPKKTRSPQPCMQFDPEIVLKFITYLQEKDAAS
jgi:HD-GYP domain-containing protein (c-di-GMP phosphodiesterase class II)